MSDEAFKELEFSEFIERSGSGGAEAAREAKRHLTFEIENKLLDGDPLNENERRYLYWILTRDMTIEHVRRTQRGAATLDDLYFDLKPDTAEYWKFIDDVVSPLFGPGALLWPATERLYSAASRSKSLSGEMVEILIGGGVRRVLAVDIVSAFQGRSTQTVARLLERHRSKKKGR